MRGGRNRRREEADFLPNRRLLRLLTSAATSDSQEQSRKFASRYGFAEAERKRIGHRGGIHISAEETIPKREGRSQILSAVNSRGMVNAMVARSDDERGERPDVDVEVCMFPELNEQPQ